MELENDIVADSEGEDDYFPPRPIGSPGEYKFCHMVITLSVEVAIQHPRRRSKDRLLMTPFQSRDSTKETLRIYRSIQTNRRLTSNPFRYSQISRKPHHTQTPKFRRTYRSRSVLDLAPYTR